MSFIKVIAHGNLTRDPQFKILPATQTPVVEFGIASNRRFKTAAGEQREEVCFIDCTAFGRTSEVINDHFRKGKAIIIEGRLKQETWEDKQGGGKRSKHVVIVDNFDFVGPKDQTDGEPGEPEHRPTPQNRRAPARGDYRPSGGKPDPAPAEAPFTGEHEFNPDDIPFVWSGRSTSAL